LPAIFHRALAKWAGRLDDAEDARNARQLFERLSGMWIKLTLLALMFHKHIAFVMAHVPGALRSIVVEPVQAIKSDVPDLHYVSWLLIGAGLLFVAHVLGVTGRAMVVRD
jgi:hypothetical protein